MSSSTLAQCVLDTARAMNASGINSGSAGNVSVRCPGSPATFLITPTGLSYADCTSDDVVALALDAPGPSVADVQRLPADSDAMAPTRIAPHNARLPSSEWRFHHDIYRAFPAAGAIVHAHSSFATALACQGMSVPAFHYMVARFGGDSVRCADYATFGTQALSDAIVAALQDRSACLMAHHGMVVFGADLAQTLSLAIELETLCEQYWRTLQLGPVRVLADNEMQRVLKKFEGYGQQ